MRIHHVRLKLAMGFGLVFGLQCPVYAQPDYFAKIRELKSSGHRIEALQNIEKELSRTNEGNEKHLLLFLKGALAFEHGDMTAAEEALQAVIQTNSNLKEYAYFYLGQIDLGRKDLKAAKGYFEKVISGNPNLKLENDVQFEIARIEQQEKAWGKARQRLTRLEKKSRGEVRYPDVLWELIKTDKAMKQQGSFCRWAKKMWIKFPEYEAISTWGLNLGKNQVEGAATQCSYNNEDKRDRIRTLQWAGLSEKAQNEIQQLRAEIGGNAEETYAMDRLEIAYLLHEGEVAKALEILKKHYEAKKNDFNYLLTLASASARFGDGQTAVGSYYRAYRMNPRGKYGRQALYQSAFLSYQFQDYDGAARRYKEFIKVFPRSGLSKDARWHLAWIRYLRADYDGALKSLAEFDRPAYRGRGKNRVLVPTQDRVVYWQAMSHLRLGQYDQARPLFVSLAKDPLIGYYAVAAGQRLRQLEQLSPKLQLRKMANGRRGVIPLRSEMLARVEDENSALPATAGEEGESEDSLSIVNFTEEAGEENMDTAAVSGEKTESKDEKVETDTAGGEESASAEKESVSTIVSPSLVKKLERARDLMTVGMSDWARWDLYDIERKTRNKDYLKNLMREYEAIYNYNRSSYIGQVYFGMQRKQLGMDGARTFWEHAYPKAYAEFVFGSSREFDVPNQLIWGIMRAESQYKKEAISPVGALGLMQVMPATAKRVATMLQDKKFETQKLLEPATAIRIGSRYLQRLAKQFEGAIPLVAASYNAGPHRTRSWMASFGHLEMDEFVEHIPYLETRNYVKKVVSNVAVYSKLYPQSGAKGLLSGLNEPLKIRISEPAPTRETWEDI